MKLKKMQRVQKVNQVVAEMGAVILSPTASERDKDEAVTRVDELKDPGASHAIRTYGDTIGLDPEGSEGQVKLLALAKQLGEDEAMAERLLAMRLLAE